MRRLFWIGLGASVGILVVRKVQKTADSLSPSGVAGSLRFGLADLTQAVRDFGDDVQVAMLERETELRTVLGLDDDGAAT
jgi:NADH/NAD ratio-sensing transcriptional regulator Rex